MKGKLKEFYVLANADTSSLCNLATIGCSEGGRNRGGQPQLYVGGALKEDQGPNPDSQGGFEGVWKVWIWGALWVLQEVYFQKL